MAYVATGGMFCAMVMGWGDTGASFIQYKITLAAAMALAGKLAVSTGGWPARLEAARQAGVESERR
jgi:hypothetical protein